MLCRAQDSGAARPFVADGDQAAAPRSAEAVLNQLMDRYAGGDDSAFRELYDKLAPRMHRFLLRLAGNVSVADELAQEAFLRIHRARGAFSRGGAVLPWAYAVTRNVFLDHERKRKTHSVVVLDESLALNHPVAASQPGCGRHIVTRCVANIPARPARIP